MEQIKLWHRFLQRVLNVLLPVLLQGRINILHCLIYFECVIESRSKTMQDIIKILF